VNNANSQTYTLFPFLFLRKVGMMQKRRLLLVFLALLYVTFEALPACGAAVPSLVGTTTHSYAFFGTAQRKSFYANGRFWIFYLKDGYNIVYRTSVDGVTWTAPTNLRASSSIFMYGYDFTVWFDGTYLHYAYMYPLGGKTQLLYRRGIPNANGTITWSADEQLVLPEVSQIYYYYPFVSVDSFGYPYVAYAWYNSSSHVWYPFVIKSRRNDGVWETADDFPYQLTTTTGECMPSIIPLTSGKMLVAYAQNGGTVRIRVWNGSSWLSEASTSSNIIKQYEYRYSIVAQGDDAHLVFLKNSTYDIIYTKYSYASNSFGNEITLVSSASSDSSPVMCINPSTNDLYVFAATKTTDSPSGWTAEHIYYIKYTASSGKWGSWIDWIDESAEVLTYAARLLCFYQAYGNYIGLAYLTKTSYPYNVKFAYLDVTPQPPPLVPPEVSTPIFGNFWLALALFTIFPIVAGALTVWKALFEGWKFTAEDIIGLVVFSVVLVVAVIIIGALANAIS
jgi:hypothetical protein